MGWRDQAVDAAPAPAASAAPADTGWKSQSVPGLPAPPDASLANGLVANAPGFKDATSPWDAFMAGMHMSASGLMASGGKSPDMQVPKNAGFFTKLSETVGQGVGDLPFNVVGAVGGAVTGGGVGAGSTIETGPGAIVGGGAGAVVGGGAGAMALPQAVRETMLDYYKMKNGGQTMTWQQVAGMIAHSSWNVAKSAIAGGVGGKVGGVAAGYAEDIAAPAFAKTASNIVGFSTGATGAQAVMDGKVPDAQDFVVGTVAALGMGVAGHVTDGRFTATDAGERVQSNQENIYRQTGVAPWEQAHVTKGDPKLHDEMIGQDVNGDPVAPKFNAQRPAEEEPYKITGPRSALTIADEHEAEVSAIWTQAHVQRHVDEMLPQIKSLETGGMKDPDHAISPTGAVGRYQIQPGTARQYGFDPSLLHDPAYNEKVARTVLADLSRRFHGDTEAVLVAYNAGPGRALRFIRDGRDTSELPRETQGYLTKAGFGGKGGEPPEPPKPPEEPAQSADGGQDFSKLTIDSLRSRFQDAIGTEPTKPMIGTGVFRQWVSELESARGVDQEMKRRGLLDPTKDISTEDMFRQTYASDDRSQYMMVKGNIDPITFDAKPGPSLTDVLTQVKDAGGNIDDFNMYRVAARTLEKANQGIDTGVFKGGAAEAGRIFQLPELQKYKAINEAMQEWKTGGLEYGRDSGLWDQGRMDAMMKANTSHVSLRRVMGDDNAFNSGGGNGAKFKARNPLKVMEGSDRQIIEPLTADMDNMRQIIRMADRNRAIGHVVMSQEHVDILGLTKLPAPEVKAMLAEPNSNVFKPYSMTPEQESSMQAFAIQSNKNANSGNRFTFFRNGVPEVWQAKDPHVAELMRGADSPGEADIITKVLSIPAKLERAGIMSAPDFALRVPMRHQLTAWVLDPNHPAPYITAIRGAMDAFGKGDAFWDLMRRGGLSGAVTEMDMAKHVDQALGDQDVLTETGALEKTWNTVTHPLQFAQIITEKLTQAERLGYYKSAVGRGIDPNKAAMMGRKAYLDFSEKATGVLANKMAQFIPFFRASMLGLRQGRDAIVDHPTQTLTYATLGLIVPQIGMYMLNRQADQYLPEKDRYTSIPQWERDQFFITPQIGGVRFRLARPYVIGPMIGTPVERMLEHTFENDPHAFDGLMKDMFSDALPSALPAAVRAPLEQTTNHNFFTGLPLVSDSLKEATADQQYTENTSEAAKKISALLGTHQGLGIAEVSPIVLDNYVQEWGGSTGAAILHTLDAPLGKPSIEHDWRDMTFVKGFVIQNPRMNTQQISEFYTDAAKWEALHKDVSLEVKRGNIEAAENDKSGVGQKAMLVVRIEHALNVQRTALMAIQRRAELNKDEKRQLSERIYNDAWNIANFGGKALRGEAVDQDAAEAMGQKASDDINDAAGQ